MKVLEISYIFFAAIILTVVNAVVIQKCEQSPQLLPLSVSVPNCQSGRSCLLLRNTVAIIEFQFRANKHYNVIFSRIKGIIGGVPLPFIGYDGTNACPHIWNEDGTQRVGCPLVEGEVYTYKNSFDVLIWYPRVTVLVHWGLGDDNSEAVCFRVPSKIR